MFSQMMQEPPGDREVGSEEKLSLACERLIKLSKKFPSFIDMSIVKELDRIAVSFPDDFIAHRPQHHLVRLAHSIHLIRKKLVKNIALFPLKSCYDLRLFPFSLQFTFGTKRVLGLLAHMHLRDKYEVFDEDHMLRIIRKSIPDAQILKGSLYAFQPQTNTIKTLYFEIDKKSGLFFTAEEMRVLRKSLKQEMQFCIEQLVPQLFMTRNEEEVLRNILTLSREIECVPDLPQVMILFDGQTSQDMTFTIILVRVVGNGVLSAYDCLAKLCCGYTIDRCQIVRYLRKKSPIEANVFKILMDKDSSIVRGDLSLNFYLARQKISQVLIDSFGKHRDFNGGIILKQREALLSFVEALPDLSMQNSELPESFFHSLSPIESQATLPINWLVPFFKIFLKALNFKIVHFSDYFLDFEIQEGQFFIMIRYSDDKLRAIINKIVADLPMPQHEIITSSLYIHNTHFLGYLVPALDSKAQEELSQKISQALKEWKWGIQNQQVLKVGLGFTPISLDPRIGGDHISSVVLKLLFEGLMRENKEGEIDYGIAKTVEVSSDLRIYRFRLRSTQWSDGSSVTAFDFEYAWKKVLSPAFNTPFAYLFYPIKNAESAKDGIVPLDAVGVKALDALVLQVELESPTPYFLELVAHPVYSPINQAMDYLHPNWPFEEKGTYVCNGAFQLAKNSQEDGYEFIKNTLYWDAENIQLNQIFLVKSNRHQAYELFNQNNNHWMGSSLGTWQSSFVPKESDEVLDCLYDGVYWYVFNTQRFPFNHKKLRRALSMAIDRSKLQELVNRPQAIAPLPPTYSQLHTTELSYNNLEMAQTLFAEALEELGLSLATFPVLPMIHLSGPIRNNVAEFFKQQWGDVLGIQCIIEPLEWDSLFAKMTGGEFVIGGMAWQSWINDPTYTLNAFKRCRDPINFSNWENDVFQEILDFAARENDPQIRKEYYLQAEKLLLDEMPVIPTVHVGSHALKKKNLITPGSSPLTNFKWAYFVPPALE